MGKLPVLPLFFPEGGARPNIAEKKFFLDAWREGTSTLALAQNLTLWVFCTWAGLKKISAGNRRCNWHKLPRGAGKDC